MRKLLIAAGALLVIFVGLVAAAALSLDRLIAGQHDRIIEEARAVLGRPVGIARISVSLWGGLGVRLDEVRIADDPRFGSEDFVQASALSVHAKLWPLLQQRFEVSRIVATQPRITVIRNADREWNYAGVRPLATKGTSALASGIVRVATAPESTVPAPAPRFVVRDITIVDGTFVVIDRTQTPVRTTRLAHLDATLRSAGAASPIAINVAAAIAGDVRNIDVHGSIGPLNDPSGLPAQLDGTLGPFAPSTARIEALHVAATLTRSQLRVQELTGRALGGAFTFSGECPVDAGAALALRGTVRDADLAEGLAAFTGDGTSPIGGTAHLIIDLSGTGTTREAIEASLAGRVVADIHQGVLTHLNLANEVLGKASRLPVVGAVVSEKIKPKYPRLFADPDTHFETLHGIFTIEDQRAQTDDLTITTAEYGVLGRGWLGFDRHIDMAAKLRMSKRFSSDVVADVHAAKYLLDDDGQLAVPFHLRGTLGEARPNLNNDDIMALVQRGAVRGGAKDLLDKFLGNQAQATPGERKNPIEEGLRRLFRR